MLTGIMMMMVRNKVAYKPPKNKMCRPVCVSVECRIAQIIHNIPEPSLNSCSQGITRPSCSRGLLHAIMQRGNDNKLPKGRHLHRLRNQRLRRLIPPALQPP